MTKKQVLINSYYNQLIKDIEILKSYNNVLSLPTYQEVKNYLNSNIVNRGNLGYQLQTSESYVRVYLDLTDFNKIRYYLLGQLVGYKFMKLGNHETLYNKVINLIR